jgi:hypothetical protein
MQKSLVNGTALVAGIGVLFDLWVSLFMADRPDTKLTRIITGIFVVGLIYSVWFMYEGWKQENSK